MIPAPPNGPPNLPPPPRRPNGYDPDMIRRFLAHLMRPGECHEITVFKAGHLSPTTIGPDFVYNRTLAGWYDSPDAVVADAAKLKGVSGFIIPNPVKPDLMARCRNKLHKQRHRTTDDDVTCLRWVLLDIDATRNPDMSATDAEREGTIATRENILIQHPEIRAASLWGTSGNGGLILPRLPDYPNDAHHRGLIARFLAEIARRFDGDGVTIDLHTKNPARLMALLGTLKCKGEDQPELGRVWRPAALECPADHQPEPLDLAAWLDDHKPPAVIGTTTVNVPFGPPSGAGGHVDKIRRASAYLAEKIARKGAAVAGQGGHNATFDAVCETGPGFDLSPDECFRLIWAEYNPHCSPPWTEQEIRHKVDEAYKVESRRGWKLTADRNHPADQGGRDVLAALLAGFQANPLIVDRQPAVIGNPHGDQQFNTWLAAHNRTDAGNAERLIARFGSSIRYCGPWDKWLVWDGKRWAIDQTKAVMRYAKQTARLMLLEAATIEDEEERKAHISWSRASESHRGMVNMVNVARADAHVAITPDVLDGDHWLLNCQNGTIDLRTGTLRPHAPTDLITKLAPVAYDPDAAAPSWEPTVSTIFAGKAAMIAFIQRLFGYFLTGQVSEQKLPIFYGTGANGKSTIINTLLELMGKDYGMQADPNLLMARKQEGHPTERADLFGKRLVITAETAEGARLNEPLLKQLTGGDHIRARRMYEDPWEFAPTHKPVLITNHKPEIRGTDHGIWRRVLLVPFEVTIPDDQQDKALPAKLTAERAGILAWAVRGCLAWQQIGLNPPAEIGAATHAYRGEQDVLGAFMAECCVTGDSAVRAKANDLYARYRAWCETNGEHSVTMRRFGLAMTERRFQRHQSNGTWYLGIGLRNEFEVHSGENGTLEPSGRMLRACVPMYGPNFT